MGQQVKYVVKLALLVLAAVGIAVGLGIIVTELSHNPRLGVGTSITVAGVALYALVAF